MDEIREKMLQAKHGCYNSGLVEGSLGVRTYLFPQLTVITGGVCFANQTGSRPGS
jgi:hypothetical protein